VTDVPPGAEWLIDKSALVRLGGSPDADQWADRIQRGLVRIATVTLLEIGYCARDAGDRGKRRPRRPPRRQDFDLIAQITGQPVERAAY